MRTWLHNLPTCQLVANKAHNTPPVPTKRQIKNKNGEKDRVKEEKPTLGLILDGRWAPFKTFPCFLLYWKLHCFLYILSPHALYVFCMFWELSVSYYLWCKLHDFYVFTFSNMNENFYKIKNFKIFLKSLIVSFFYLCFIDWLEETWSILQTKPSTFPLWFCLILYEVDSLQIFCPLRISGDCFPVWLR